MDRDFFFDGHMVGRYLPESFILDTPGRPEPLGNAGFRAASSRLVPHEPCRPAAGLGSGDEVPAVAVSGKSTGPVSRKQRQPKKTQPVSAKESGNQLGQDPE